MYRVKCGLVNHIETTQQPYQQSVVDDLLKLEELCSFQSLVQLLISPVSALQRRNVKQTANDQEV